ncbi:hypothetical protein BAU15_04005 [Enterococcus sp. JM4C]|uniref:hypothetical protein n=1 Tax=Candidatus Enterococcus huntleyi TaxID=1857217 RepID=UPI001379BB0B|nr:hypothetical protein [Enterococcus sp. JM4C]KAF1295708.1 hypothetical protein BAU15_04005 [Enterococcus sp. JM4C]
MKHRFLELRGAVYTIEIMLASIIYSLAFLIRNPKFYPALIYIVLAAAVMLYILVAKKETFDERGWQSFMKASAVTFFVSVFALVLFTILMLWTQWVVTLSVFLLLIVLSAVILIHGIAFIMIDSGAV